MKRASLIYFLFLLILSPFITACDKEDDDTSMSKTELLVAKTWQGNAVFASGVNITDNPDLLKSMPDVRTLTLKFRADGTYTANYIDDGKAIEQDGNWEFRENETVLFFDLMSNYKLNIGTLNNERLILTTDVNYQGFNVPAEVRFTGQ